MFRKHFGTKPHPTRDWSKVRRNRGKLSARALHRRTLHEERRSAMLAHAGASAAAIKPLPSWLVRLSVAILWSLIILLSWSPRANAQETDDGAILDLSLEQLLDVEITSVSKTAQKRSEAAAAIYVITSEDIRRSSATTIPDLLRTVPGLYVAQLNASQWTVTSRGFSGRFANKLLVLIDGRSVYTPFFSGVYWEGQDVMLEDVDRIEIIRGPGGTLWGANAVNGVINIVTKTAEETQGGLLRARGGTEELASLALRYGGKVKDRGHYRAYVKGFARDEGGSFGQTFQGLSGGSANDEWQSGQGGFRVDLDIANNEKLTLQGDVVYLDSSSTLDLTFRDPVSTVRTTSDGHYTGGNLLGRWTRTFSEESDLQLQMYYDIYNVEDITLEETRHTIDVDFQHRLPAGNRHSIIYGAGYRLTWDNFDNTQFIQLDPERRALQIVSAFLQDEISLLDTLKLTIGTKIEYNTFSDFELQPSARIAWTPNDQHTVWAAVSRAVRTPTRSEHDYTQVFAEGGTVDIVTIVGNDDFKAEKLVAFELGYRWEPSKRVAFDIAGFYNIYDDLRTVTFGAGPFTDPGPPPVDILPFPLSNDASMHSYGLELTADFVPKPWWLIRANYSVIGFRDRDILGVGGDDNVPLHRVNLQNQFDLPRNVEFDTTLRWVDDISSLGIGSYVELDARLAWRPREDLELALVGRNLFDSEHIEFTPLVAPTVPTAVERSFYAQVKWEF